MHIPSNPEYGVLNVASALQVVCYEIRMAWLEAKDGKAPHFDEWDMPPAKQQDLEYYFDHLEETLTRLGFLEKDNPRQTVTRIRRLYTRLRVDEMELSILRGILTSMQNYIHRHPDDKADD